MLHQVKKGKSTARKLIAPLETAIKLPGNAAAHLSMERRRAIMRHLKSNLKSLAEGDFSDGGRLQFEKDFASKAKSTADNVKALKGFIPFQGRPQRGVPGAATKPKGNPSSLRVTANTGAHNTTSMARDPRCSTAWHLPFVRTPQFRSRPSSQKRRHSTGHPVRYLYNTYKTRMDQGHVQSSIPWGWFSFATQSGPNYCQLALSVLA